MKKLIRIIPNLLISDNHLVKGKNFKNHKYIGDIFNAVKIFSEKKVHEIQLQDISSRNKRKSIDVNLIKKIRSEIFVPLSVGGGIDNIDQASELINEGVEKIILNTVLFENMELITELSNKFGSQSAVISIDVKKIDEKYFIFSENGTKFQDADFFDFLKKIQDKGAGEIMITSIDKEGMKSGFDLELFSKIHNFIKVPLIASGGAAKLNDIYEIFDKTTVTAVSCGTIFVFFGPREAVLINYPDIDQIEKVMSRYD
jgi:cyclase